LEFMPEFAPLALLTFMGTCFLLGVAGIIVIYGLVRKKGGLVQKVLVVALAVAGLYVTLLLAASLASHERVLRAGEQKYFCEVDCHEAYSVVNVRATKTLGAPPEQKTAEGTYYVVTVKVWFDERTISSRRDRNMPLTPNPRTVAVVDESGREYGPSPDGQKVLEQAQGKSIPFTELLRPGESYTTHVVFDLPSGIRNPRLFITTPVWPTWLLIGHENSPFHKRVLFRLEPQPEPTARAGPQYVCLSDVVGDALLRQTPFPC